MEPLSAFGPGKVILIGEHAAVYGHPVLAGPLSYLLASDAFDAGLGDLLKESIPDTVEDRARAESEVEEILAVLKQRKDNYRRRQPAIVNLIAASEIARFLINGLVGRIGLPYRFQAVADLSSLRWQTAIHPISPRADRSPPHH